MEELKQRLEKQLNERKRKGNHRKLPHQTFAVDFLSNDYLGLARSQSLQAQMESRQKTFPPGATGSRLLSGNSEQAREAEAYLAAIFGAESSLLFTSGYAANLGLLSSVPQKGDTILYDELSHSSIKDGMRLSFARRFAFRHNDLADLEQKISRASGIVFVVVEAVYSMDGDQAPLEAIASICDKYQACLIVDEAHSTGIFGPAGSGLCAEKQLSVFARIHTFGKAIGAHGAAISGEETLIDYLVNFSRPFIYTTALPLHSVESIRLAFQYLETHANNLQQELNERITFFNRLFEEKLSRLYQKISSQSPVQALIVAGNKQAATTAAYLQQAGYNVRPILAPTVPPGQERLRICLHIYNTEAEIEGLIDKLATLKQE